jgi:hypothetical protein
MSKSSVELFAIALYEGGYLQGNGDEINDLLKHYKALHKKEIIKSFQEGQEIPPLDDTKDEYSPMNYYNETYGGKK